MLLLLVVVWLWSQELNLEDNQITVIPVSFGNLSKLQTLSVRGNKITSPPMLVCMHGAVSIINYLRELSVGKAKISGMRTPSLKREKNFTYVSTIASSHCYRVVAPLSPPCNTIASSINVDRLVDVANEKRTQSHAIGLF
jgi:hypothetical protein